MCGAAPEDTAWGRPLRRRWRRPTSQRCSNGRWIPARAGRRRAVTRPGASPRNSSRSRASTEASSPSGRTVIASCHVRSICHAALGGSRLATTTSASSGSPGRKPHLGREPRRLRIDEPPVDFDHSPPGIAALGGEPSQQRRLTDPTGSVHLDQSRGTRLAVQGRPELRRLRRPADEGTLPLPIAGVPPGSYRESYERIIVRPHPPNRFSSCHSSKIDDHNSSAADVSHPAGFQNSVMCAREHRRGGEPAIVDTVGEAWAGAAPACLLCRGSCWEWDWADSSTASCCTRSCSGIKCSAERAATTSAQA